MPRVRTARDDYGSILQVSLLEKASGPVTSDFALTCKSIGISHRTGRVNGDH